MTTKTVTVDQISRLEGEGALRVTIEQGELRDVQLRIFEPPRFFEALLQGRDFREAPDITSRICGICPIAYLLSSAQAMEDACGATLDPGLRALRRLIYCGEWIESHVLHIAMLHLPDFLGYPDGIAMAADHPELVERSLRLKALGNRIIRLLGGREIHPINIRVGGFYRLPDPRDLAELRTELEWGAAAARDNLRALTALEFPDFEGDWDFVAMHPGDRYPFTEGPIACEGIGDMSLSAYGTFLNEVQAPHSTALQNQRPDDQRPLYLGAMARFAHNRAGLTPMAASEATAAGLDGPCRNPYRSILVRAVEVLFACEEALHLIDTYVAPDAPAVAVRPRAGIGHGCTEAPRGACFHRYEIDDAGEIVTADIVPPTAVNQVAIEADLRAYVAPRLDRSEDDLRAGCERVIRNYDPCISCATHFLTLEIDDTGGAT